MGKLIAYRALTLVPVLLLVSLAAFSLSRIMPGSPAATILGPRATPEAVRELEARLGLDTPFVPAFVDWLSRAAGGDLGTSLRGGRSVRDMILQAIVPSLALTLGAIVIATVAGGVLGIVGALRAGTATDRGITIATAVGLAVPEFWLGVILLLVFAVGLGWAPVISWTDPRQDLLACIRGLVLPALALGAAGAALIARQMRGAMLDALDAPYIRTLRAAGTPSGAVVGRYALKNAVIPVITACGFLFVSMTGASFVVEQVFTIPGLGSVALNAVTERDLPVIQGVALVVAVLVAVVYLVLDIAYGLLNPRARPQ